MKGKLGFLIDIDNEATIVVADTMTEAMQKAEEASVRDYRVVYYRGIPVLK